MAEHTNFGIKGEDLAVNFLKSKNYIILERNWRINHKEIDIIAKKDNTIVLVEVKSRSTLAFGEPEEAVGIKKQKLLIDAAEAYLIQNNIDLDVQFDIISIVKIKNNYEIKHIESAFYSEIE